jgi:hypothetical protein
MISRKADAIKGPQPNGAGVFVESRYVWVFQCSTRLALHAATLDRNARNVPQSICHEGEWVLNGQLIVGPQNAPMAGIDIEALKVGIEEDGYYVWSADTESPLGLLQLMR